MVPWLALTPNSNRVWGSNLSSGRPAYYPGLILDKILDKRIRGDRWDWLQQTQVWRKQVQMRTDWLLTPVFRSGTSAAYLPAEGAKSQEMAHKSPLNAEHVHTFSTCTSSGVHTFRCLLSWLLCSQLPPLPCSHCLQYGRCHSNQHQKQQHETLSHKHQWAAVMMPFSGGTGPDKEGATETGWAAWMTRVRVTRTAHMYLCSCHTCGESVIGSVTGANWWGGGDEGWLFAAFSTVVLTGR